MAEKMEGWFWYDGGAGFRDHPRLLQFSVPDIPKHPQQSGETQGHDEGVPTSLRARPSRGSTSNKKRKKVTAKHSWTTQHSNQSTYTYLVLAKRNEHLPPEPV